MNIPPSLSLNDAIIQRYSAECRHFVETGTYRGGGVAAALKVGFESIHSIEIAKHFYEENTRRFANESSVTLHHGDSSLLLPAILKKLVGKAFVFLDAHYFKGNPRPKGDTKNCAWRDSPLRLELESMAAVPGMSHVIAVDDIDICGTAMLDHVCLDEVKLLIQKLNPRYEFAVVNSCRKNSLLIAKLANGA